jgi:hypothetical protein
MSAQYRIATNSWDGNSLSSVGAFRVCLVLRWCSRFAGVMQQ